MLHAYIMHVSIAHMTVKSQITKELIVVNCIQ